MKKALFLMAVLAFAAHPLAAATTCESLMGFALKNAKIMLAQPVGAGEFTPPAGRGGAANNSYRNLPAFCRIGATLTPVSDSEIKIEVWLPVAGWNGKLEALGNGAWAGSIARRRRYACRFSPRDSADPSVSRQRQRSHVSGVRS